MGKSINPMYSFQGWGEAAPGSAPSLIALKRDSFAAIVLMSLQSAIPQQVALLHCLPPLHWLDSIFHPPAGTVNHHLTRAGEFSTGRTRNFQPELTQTTAQVTETPKRPFPVLPTSKILALGRFTSTPTPDQLKSIFPKEVPDTLRLYLAGKIDQMWARQDQKGPVFLMNDFS